MQLDDFRCSHTRLLMHWLKGHSKILVNLTMKNNKAIKDLFYGFNMVRPGSLVSY